MNRSRLLMIGGLALGAGLLVAFSVYNKLRTSPGSNGSERAVRVVVAADDVLVGVKLDAYDVRVINFRFGAGRHKRKPSRSRHACPGPSR